MRGLLLSWSQTSCRAVSNYLAHGYSWWRSLPIKLPSVCVVIFFPFIIYFYFIIYFILLIKIIYFF